MIGPAPNDVIAPRVWVTRSSPGASATSEALNALGFETITAPLVETRALEFDPPSARDFDAAAFSSAAAVRLFVADAEMRSLPVLTVGDATAAAARRAGWRQVDSADGDVSALAALIARRFPGGRILHPCARDPAGDLAGALNSAACRVTSLPVYETVSATKWPEGLVSAVRTAPIAGILVQSPSAGRALAELGSNDPSDLRNAVVFALSDACAAPLRSMPFREIIVSPFPKQEALLKVVCDRLCASPSAAR